MPVGVIITVVIFARVAAGRQPRIRPSGFIGIFWLPNDSAVVSAGQSRLNDSGAPEKNALV